MASVTARGKSWRVQSRDHTGRMRAATFQLRSDADDFAALIDERGWEAAYSTLRRDGASALPGPMSLDGLRETVLQSNDSDWHMPDLLGDSAVLKSDLSIALRWEHDVNAERGGDDAYPCYTGLTRGADVVGVLFQGQPIFQATLLTVSIRSRRRRDEALLVPLAHLSRRKWYADAMPYALAGLVNGLWWRSGYESYMEAAGVRPSD